MVAREKVTRKMFARKMSAKNNRPGPVLSEDVSIHGIFVVSDANKYVLCRCRRKLVANLVEVKLSP